MDSHITLRYITVCSQQCTQGSCPPHPTTSTLPRPGGIFAGPPLHPVVLLSSSFTHTSLFAHWSSLTLKGFYWSGPHDSLYQMSPLRGYTWPCHWTWLFLTLEQSSWPNIMNILGVLYSLSSCPLKCSIRAQSLCRLQGGDQSSRPTAQTSGVEELRLLFQPLRGVWGQVTGGNDYSNPWPAQGKTSGQELGTVHFHSSVLCHFSSWWNLLSSYPWSTMSTRNSLLNTTHTHTHYWEQLYDLRCPSHFIGWSLTIAWNLLFSWLVGSFCCFFI